MLVDNHHNIPAGHSVVFTDEEYNMSQSPEYAAATPYTITAGPGRVVNRPDYTLYYGINNQLYETLHLVDDDALKVDSTRTRLIYNTRDVIYIAIKYAFPGRNYLLGALLLDEIKIEVRSCGIIYYAYIYLSELLISNKLICNIHEYSPMDPAEITWLTNLIINDLNKPWNI